MKVTPQFIVFKFITTLRRSHTMQIHLELLKSRWPRDMISCATSCKQFKGLQHQCNQSPCTSYYAGGQTVPCDTAWRVRALTSI